MAYIDFTAEIREGMGIRTVQAKKDHPSGLFVDNDVVYALLDIKIFIPNPMDADEAAEYPFDKAQFAEYFDETVAAAPVVVDHSILTFETFDDTRKEQLGARQVRALKDSPVELFAEDDLLWAQDKFAIYIEKPGDATKSCRYDFDGGLFDKYFRELYCRVATLFSDAFASGNVGWTVITPAGTVTFSGGKMNAGASGLDAQGNATKALAAPPAGAWTAAFKFTEVDAAPSANKIYTLGMAGGTGDCFLIVALTADGTGIVADLTKVYSFEWTPEAGATHALVFTRDGADSLTMTLDGVAVELTESGAGPITGTASKVEVSITNSDLDGMGAFDDIYLTDGIVDTDDPRFCAPGEDP